MSDPWAAIGPTIATSAITTLLTLGLTGGVRALTKRHASRKFVFRLYQGAASTWRLQNTSGRMMYGVDCRVDPGEGRDWRSANEDDGVPGSRDLPKGDELYFRGLQPSDTLLIAWTKVRRELRPGDIHTAEIHLRPNVYEYDVRESTLTYGWGYGPH